MRRNRLVARGRTPTVLCLLGMLCGSGLRAQQSSSADVKRLQDDLTVQRAVAIAQERRISEEREILLFAELEKRDRDLRVLLAENRRSRSDVTETQKKLDSVIAEKGELVEIIASRDRAYAAEVAEYRRQVSGLTNTNDPKLQEALRRFADGDRVGAFPVIEEILRAEIRASERATAVRNAARLRELGTLALTMKGRGEKSVDDVIKVWESAQAVDDTHHWGWIELARLYLEKDSVELSEKAARKSLNTAGNDRERAVSYMAIGDARRANFDSPGAIDYFRQSLALMEGLAKSRVDNPVAQRDLAIALQRLGRTPFIPFLDAKAYPAIPFTNHNEYLDRAVTIFEQLARQSPANLAAQTDLGDALIARGGRDWLLRIGTPRADLEAALTIFERVVREDPSSYRGQYFVSLALERLGQGLISDGDFTAIRTLFPRGLSAHGSIPVASAHFGFARDIRATLRMLSDAMTAASFQRFASSAIHPSFLQRLADADPSTQRMEDSHGISYRLKNEPVLAQHNVALRTFLEQEIKLLQQIPCVPADCELVLAYWKLGRVSAALEGPAASRPAFERALALCERMLEASKDFPDSGPASLSKTAGAVTLELLGIVDLSTGKGSAAQVRLERALALREDSLAPDPDLSWEVDRRVRRLLLLLGDSLEERGDTEGARRFFERLLADDEKKVRDDEFYLPRLLNPLESRSRLIGVFARSGDAARAKAEALASVKLAERIVREERAGLEVAMALIVSSLALDSSSAENALKLALSITESDPKYVVLKGPVLIRLGRLNDAVAHLRSQVDETPAADPTRSHYLCHLATARLLGGETDSALAMFREALASSPEIGPVLRRDLRDLELRGMSRSDFDRVRALIEGR